jgi:hypothetical protein
MKSITSTLCVLALVGLSVPARAALVVPGTTGPGANSDGELSITADTVIDLSKATTGTWDQDNTANQGNGVYDPEKWAVVFKYTSVNVLAGKTLTFKNHATRAPVVWLVSGNVTIAGKVNLSGESVGPYFNPVQSPLGAKVCEPGPGGFRGGSGYRGGNILHAGGFGPGGGTAAEGSDSTGGGYGEDAPDRNGYRGGKKYGNPSLIPLLGGSGGGGEKWNNDGFSGGGGGGAILVACSGKINFITGSSLIALGGNGEPSRSGGGSGGGIRLVCDELVGEGNISAAGGSGGNGMAVGGSGRIRLERVLNTAVLTINPAPSTIDLTSGTTPVIWPPENSPDARIVAVNGIAPASDPKAAFGAYSPDVALPLVSGVSVIVETINVEKASSVIVRATPRNGTTVAQSQVTYATEVNATITEVVSETPLKLRWEATVPTLPGYSAIQARIVRP